MPRGFDPDLDEQISFLMIQLIRLNRHLSIHFIASSFFLQFTIHSLGPQFCELPLLYIL